MAQRGALVVFGIGPLVGRALASKFVSEGFNNVILLSRNAQNLQDEKAAILKDSGNSGAKIDTIVCDLDDAQSVAAALKKIDSSGETIETVLYNAATVKPSGILKDPAGDIEAQLQTCVSGLYRVAQWALPLLVANAKKFKHPSFIVPNSDLWKNPHPVFFSLSIAKAAQRVLVQTLNMTYAPQGVHVALISACGLVKWENKKLNPKHIADEAWRFFENSKPEDLEVEIRED